MNRRHCLLLAAGVLLPLVATVAPAQAAPAPSVLTVTGSSSAQSFVTLARPSTVDTTAMLASPQVRITGKGRVVGVVLEQVGGEATLEALNFNTCDTPGCTPLQVFPYVTGSRAVLGPDGSQVTLPAGRYRVVLVADGAPVSARLTLSGLGSPITIRPTAGTDVTFRPVESVTDPVPAPAKSVFSGGRTYPAGAERLVLFQQLHQTAAAAAATTGLCIVLGDPPPGDLYTPTCPTTNPGDDRVNFSTQVTAVDPAAYAVADFGAVGVPADLTVSVGTYVVSAVPVVRASAVQVEIPLGAPQATPAAAVAPPTGASPTSSAGPAAGLPVQNPSIPTPPVQAAAPALELPDTGPSEALPLAGLTVLAGLALTRRTGLTTR